MSRTPLFTDYETGSTSWSSATSADTRGIGVHPAKLIKLFRRAIRNRAVSEFLAARMR